MKKIIFFVPLLAISSLSKGQTNTFPASGNVGVGITNPQSLMHVNGEVRSKRNWITEDGLRAVEIAPTGIYTGVGNWTPTARSIHYEIAGGWDLSQIQIRAGGSSLKNTIRLQTDWNGTGEDGKGGVYFGLRSTDTHVMLSNGNVGFGTLNPKERLSVRGKILAEEIRVTTATSDWPDYVFNKDYQLMPLDSLANFIKINGHLPEMPTANEVAGNGVQLGEMVNKLLKKNEELTLHLIEKDKKIAQQEKTLEIILQRLEKLETK